MPIRSDIIRLLWVLLTLPLVRSQTRFPESLAFVGLSKPPLQNPQQVCEEIMNGDQVKRSPVNATQDWTQVNIFYLEDGETILERLFKDGIPQGTATYIRYAQENNRRIIRHKTSVPYVDGKEHGAAVDTDYQGDGVTKNQETHAFFENGIQQGVETRIHYQANGVTKNYETHGFFENGIQQGVETRIHYQANGVTIDYTIESSFKNGKKHGKEVYTNTNPTFILG